MNSRSLLSMVPWHQQTTREDFEMTDALGRVRDHYRTTRLTERLKFALVVPGLECSKSRLRVAA
jgi:hypothetical protein